MLLSDILNNVKVIQVSGNAEERDISAISIDSRKVDKNKLFFALRGYRTDGHKFIQDAVSRGVKAVVLDNNDYLPEAYFKQNGVVKVLVNDSRKALAVAADTLYGHPSGKLKLIGITGTKGKTTFTYFLRSVLKAAGVKSGIIGTIENYIGENKVPTVLTTPEAHTINELMSEMVNAGCGYCIMEVSSHSLVLERVRNLEFDAALFSNITSDHLDFHETFEKYRDAKKILFDNLSAGSVAVVNADDKSASYMIKDTKAETVTAGTEPNSDFAIKDIIYDLMGTRFTVSYAGKNYNLETSLVGPFNAYNATLAFAAAVKTGIDPEAAVQGIKDTPQVPGRFEILSKGEKKVIIDYSHTSGSLEAALEAIHAIKEDNIPVHTVMGCGGDRDKTKRPVMGGIASRLSDRVVITSDNPRTEDPYAIIEDIKKGITKDNYVVMENREAAIKEAILGSEKNAVVLVAGKGHETYQEINGVRHHFSDKDTAIKYMDKDE